MELTLVDTWLVPIGTDTHWALRVVRKPQDTRDTWDVALYDSLPSLEMQHIAQASLAQLGHSCLLPAQLSRSLQCVAVPKQEDHWICGYRVAHHAKHVLANLEALTP